MKIYVIKINFVYLSFPISHTLEYKQYSMSNDYAYPDPNDNDINLH